jgi:hypothetical protein
MESNLTPIHPASVIEATNIWTVSSLMGRTLLPVMQRAGDMSYVK